MTPFGLQTLSRVNGSVLVEGSAVQSKAQDTNNHLLPSALSLLAMPYGWISF